MWVAEPCLDSGPLDCALRVSCGQSPSNAGYRAQRGRERNPKKITGRIDCHWISIRVCARVLRSYDAPMLDAPGCVIVSVQHSGFCTSIQNQRYSNQEHAADARSFRHSDRQSRARLRMRACQRRDPLCSSHPHIPSCQVHIARRRCS